MPPVSLTSQQLRLTIDPETLGFERLSELEAMEKNIVGQERAIQALTFGLRMLHPDFNIYVAGIQETGLADLAKSYVDEVAQTSEAKASDWCYVHNFRDSDAPLVVELPRGQGREFRRDMAELVDNLKLHIPQIFEGEIYVTRKEEVIRAFNKDRAKYFEELNEKVKAEDFLLQADQTGMMVMPAKEDGSPLSPEDISKLPEEEQKVLRAKSEVLHREMGATMRSIHQLEQGVRKKLKELDRELVGQTAESLIGPLREKYASNQVILDYLKDVRDDVVQELDNFRQKGGESPVPFPFPGAAPSFTQYQVNVLVDNSETKGAPVVLETNPSYSSIFGAVERKAQFGALFTDFTMIKAGTLHKANGGFLILKALDLLKRPFSYEALKRALRHRQLTIEDISEEIGLFTTKALSPKPIPLRVKIVLVGNPFLYDILFSYDEDFRELFKIKAHMDVWVDRNEERLGEFLRSLRALIARDSLRDVDKTGAARLIEYSAELAGSQEKLTLRQTEVADTLREADFWAGSEGSEVITAAHVQKAILQKIYRAGLYADHLQEMLKKDILKVTTDGFVVGQVNGLSIYNMGEYVFGKPSRITANIALGKEGVVNIEREAELSGQIHTKGVMIMAGYLRALFSLDKPLSLTATLCFEQSYGMVEGDSASGAELFSLLSTLSGLGIDQGIAMTGAVSQKGEILAVGGVTRKIEGFFDLCFERSLTGRQGVIIPEINVRDLMLKQEVIDAVEAGRFHIWPIRTVEEGLEILTGRPAGVPGPDGRFEEGTVFGMVDARLAEMAEEARRFMLEEREEGGADQREERSDEEE